MNCCQVCAVVALSEEDSLSYRLPTVLIDELVPARKEASHLPVPTAPRLRRIIETMMETPTDRRTLDTWAEWIGMSGRTLERAISRKTGMSFGRLRQQLAVMLAVKLLAADATIQQVAAELGYESVPSFVTMFRKAAGVAPGRYMADR